MARRAYPEARAGRAIFSPAKIHTALAAIHRFPGVTGTVSYHPGSRVPDKSVSIIALKDGTLHLAEALMPAWVPEP